MIVSSKNQKVKDIRRYLRCKGERAVLEGPHLVRESLESGSKLDLVLAVSVIRAMKKKSSAGFTKRAGG